MSSNWVGKTLGRVQIEAPIARGGVAEVYVGTHITLHRKVAVKILRDMGEEHSDALERFQREARVVASLRHPNIVQVYDFDMVDSDPYLVMEYIKGPSLSKYLYFLHHEKKKLGLPHIVRLIRGVASALQYAHNNGIVHRDIKPGNILLTSPTTGIKAGEPLPDDFEPVLTDFGLIRFLDSSRQTTTGVTAGTPAYMSPEQAQGDPTDGRTDVYSLGIVLYEMLAGKLPFDGETTMSILLKHMSEPPQPIPNLPSLINQVLDRALAKNPKDRFQTPLEFANAFSAAVDINPATLQIDGIPSFGPSTLDFHNSPTQVTTEKQEQPRRSSWMRIAILGAFVITVGGFLLFNGLPFSKSDDPTATMASTDTLTLTSTSTSTNTPTPQPILMGTSVVLRFQDGKAIADQAVLEAQRMTAPPAGNQYEVWLINGKSRISLGILSLDEAGTGELTYTEPQGANLVAIYDRTEITVEPENDTKPESSGQVAYSFTLPADGLTNVRDLLATYTNTPNKTALIQRLYASIKTINELAVGMQTSFENGNETQVRRNAEAILNLIKGTQSPNYKDWDGNGFLADDSDGYGLSLNGSSPGYFQAVYTEADNTVKSANASEPMVMYGEYLKITVQNLAQWTLQLEEFALAVLESPSQNNVSDLVALTDKMLNGTDLDNNGKVDPVRGESSAQFAYQYAYSMANMPLSPVGFQNIGTGTPTFIGVTSGPSGGGGGGGASTPIPGNTAPGQVKTPPGQVKTDRPKEPTKTDRPPLNNNGNNN